MWHSFWIIKSKQPDLGQIYLYLILALFGTKPDNSTRTTAINYIETYKELAVVEMYRSGVPASITMAQALHESNLGLSKLATIANNHFGIKCKSYWTGQTYYHKDDDRNKVGILIESCFRSYTSALDSYVDHSNFLKLGSNYIHLFFLDRHDYIGWAHGLQKAGYATDKAYAHKLIKKIEEYRLYELDRMENPLKKVQAHRSK